MAEFYHASAPGRSPAGGTRILLGAMLRFHARVGVRLALRILAPSLAILFALYFILRPEFFVNLATVILFDSGPLARGAFSTLIAFAAARAAAPRVCLGLGGWMRHLPSSAALTRRMAVLAIAIAELPVLGILAAFAVLSARSSPGRLPVDILGLAGLGIAAASAAVRVKSRAPRTSLGLAAGTLFASGSWPLFLGGIILIAAVDRISGPVLSSKKGPAPLGGRHPFGLPAAVAVRAVGSGIVIPILLAGIVLALIAAFLANNPLPASTAAAAGRFGGALAAAVFLGGAASLLAARRPPWPLERSWPRSARRRVLVDAALLAGSAAVLLIPLALIEAQAVPFVAAILPLAGLRASSAVRLDRELRFGAWGMVLGEGAFIALAICFAPWAVAALLAAAVPALEAAARIEKRLKVSRWLELHHLSAGDPLSWSEG
jgi:hypothetical protein